MNGPNFRKPSMKHDAYLRYVRALPCVGCGVWGQQHAHHLNSDRHSSAKVSDVLTLPLCEPCHTELHRNWPAWEVRHGSQWMHAAKTFEQAVRDGVFNLDSKMAQALGNAVGSP